MSEMSPERSAVPYDAAWADRLARLMRILDGVEITERTKGFLEYLAKWESSTDAAAELLEATRRASYPKIELDDEEEEEDPTSAKTYKAAVRRGIDAVRALTGGDGETGGES